MKVFALMIVAALALTACNKDDFQTKPKIEIKSAGPDLISNGGLLTVRIDFKDKEGDVDSTLYIIRRRENVRDVFTTKQLTIPFDIPPFPDKSKGEIQVNLDHTLLTFNNTPISMSGGINQPDTLSLRFFVKDAAGNLSDTVALDQNIIVIR